MGNIKLENSLTQEQLADWANPDARFMNYALAQARIAFEKDEVPVGAVIVCNGRILGKGYNQTVTMGDPTAHAEMLAITAACNHLNNRILSDCIMYVTLEPCVMCAGAIAWARLKRLVFAAAEPKYGFTRLSASILHPDTQVTGGVLSEVSAELLKTFFKRKRS
jgi:tRNA(adenine34) deaminase